VSETTVESYDVRGYVDGEIRIKLHLGSGTDASLVDLDGWRARLVVGLLRQAKPVYWDPEKRTLWISDESIGADETAFDLDAWLGTHTKVRQAIFWETPEPEPAGLHYTDWSDAMKGDLRHAVATLFEGGSLGITDPPPLAYTPPEDQEFGETRLAEGVAWAIFSGHIAQSIFCDASGYVSWSLGDLEDSELAELFDSRRLFAWNAENATYGIAKDTGSVTPGDPSWVFEFLVAHNLVGENRLDTIHRILGWCCSKLLHYGRGPGAPEDYWQYPGEPPVRRVLEGTLHPHYEYEPPRHWTAGCHGTVGLLRAVLRTVNIPVAYIYMHGHAQPHFLQEGLYLSHGDDVLAGVLEAHPPMPVSLLPIDDGLYTVWFGPAVDELTAQRNVGRRSVELAIEFLPDWLLRLHCEDLDAGSPPETSKVFGMLSYYWTLDELQAVSLWTRMDDTLADIGGCAAVAPKPWTG
jgi:hypothetical protein